MLNRVLNKLVNFSNHPDPELRMCDTYDWYAPTYQHHHTPGELCEWFEAAGFGHLLGVVEGCGVLAVGGFQEKSVSECDSRGDDGSGQGATACFVQAD